MSSQERKALDVRQESIRLIAHALEALDRNESNQLGYLGQGRYKVSVEYQSEADYLADAGMILDAEIVRMAEERIMARIRANATERISL